MSRSKEPTPCTVTMPSTALPGHTHSCADVHEAGDHRCSDPKCGRYFAPGSKASVTQK